MSAVDRPAGSVGRGSAVLAPALAAVPTPTFAFPALELRDGQVTDGDAVRVDVGDDLVTLEHLLAMELYVAWHLGRRTRSRRPPRASLDDEFVSGYKDGTPHAVTTSPSWRRVGTEHDGRQVVSRGGVRLLLDPADVHGAGEKVSVVLPAVLPRRSPGFWMVDGSAGSAGGADLVRVYLAVDAEHAALAWRAAIGALEDGGIGYRAKALAAASSFPRYDAIVVYLAADQASRAIEPLVAALAGVPLLPGVSPFTLPLARGIAVAFEPSGGDLAAQSLSFGQHRARAVARAVRATIDAGPGGAVPSAHLLDASLRAAEVDPARPWRNLDSPEIFDA